MHNMKGMGTAFLDQGSLRKHSDVTSTTRQPKTNLEIAAEAISF